MTGPSSNEAPAHFRAHRQGTLIADDVPSHTRFILDGATGRLVFPAPGAALAAESLVLFIPEETPDGSGELQVMLSASELDPSAEACDRWRAYHGEPRLSRWAACAIEGAKFNGSVVDHEALNAPNPLRAEEPALCKALNADHAALTLACQRQAGVEIADPVAVGIDPWGIDVRARFGIVRCTFDAPAPNAAAANSAIKQFLMRDSS